MSEEEEIISPEEEALRQKYNDDTGKRALYRGKPSKPYLTWKETEATKDVDAFELDEVESFDEESSELERELTDEEEAFEEEIEEERFYTIPLAKEYMKAPKWKRSKKAVKALREFLSKHMKEDKDYVFISQDLNELIWENGIKNPPRKVRVRVTKSVDGIVRAYPA